MANEHGRVRDVAAIGRQLVAALEQAPGDDILDALMMLMTLMARSAEEDLRDTLTAMEAAIEEKRRLRALGRALAAGADQPRRAAGATDDDVRDGRAYVQAKLDRLSALGEQESLRLQMAMDRLSKLMSTLSNLMKKASDTAQTITQNLK